MIFGMPTLPATSERLQELGRLIRARRDRLGMTIEEAAELTADENGEVKPTSPTTWARIEKGQGGRAQGRTYARIERRIGWAPGSCTHFLDDGTQPSLAAQLGQAVEANEVPPLTARVHADDLAAKAPPLSSTEAERDSDGRFKIRVVDKAGREVVVLAFPGDVTMTPEAIEYLAKIAAGVSLGNHPESEPDS